MADDDERERRRLLEIEDRRTRVIVGRDYPDVTWTDKDRIEELETQLASERAGSALFEAALCALDAAALPLAMAVDMMLDPPSAYNVEVIRRLAVALHVARAAPAQMQSDLRARVDLAERRAQSAIDHISMMHAGRGDTLDLKAAASAEARIMERLRIAETKLDELRAQVPAMETALRSTTSDPVMPREAVVRGALRLLLVMLGGLPPDTGEDHGDKTLPLALAELRQRDADIIVLQEALAEMRQLLDEAHTK
jgi:hypothetical protein